MTGERHSAKQMTTHSSYLMSNLVIRTYSCCDASLYRKVLLWNAIPDPLASPQTQGLGSKHHSCNTYCL